MEASKKSPAIDALITQLTGIDRVGSIEAQTCVFCNSPVTEDSFKDDISLKEFKISGICQVCQDKIFG
jgi:hypothetical protein